MGTFTFWFDSANGPFFEAETTAAAFEICCLYVDKDSIYRPGRDRTIDEEMADEPAKTQFGRAMAWLGVESICAHRPQAKGRVERRNGVFSRPLGEGVATRGNQRALAKNRGHFYLVLTGRIPWTSDRP